MKKLINKDGLVRYRSTFTYYAGKKYGYMEYWPEILDDICEGYHYEGFYEPIKTSA